MVAACRDPSKLLPQFKGEVRKGDLRDADYLDRLLVGIDIICHAAGWSSFENSGKISNTAYLEPTLNLINHASEWRVSRFINLSSLYVAAAKMRNVADTKGQPRSYWPMINCHIAVEEYLRSFAQSRCQFINLRLGLYSGKRLNMGLLALLLTQGNKITLPYLSGSLGHLPIVDGRDIGQAFARAAFAPFESNYTSLNISGPDTPSHKAVMEFIAEQIQTQPLIFALPSLLADPIIWLQNKIYSVNNQPALTPAMQNMLKSPTINNELAKQQMGYDPQVSWQASLLDTLEQYKNKTLNNDLTQQDRPLNF